MELCNELHNSLNYYAGGNSILKPLVLGLTTSGIVLNLQPIISSAAAVPVVECGVVRGAVPVVECGVVR